MHPNEPISHKHAVGVSVPRSFNVATAASFNQRCALTPDLESILRARTGKIVLQHNLPIPDSCIAAKDFSFDHLVSGTERKTPAFRAGVS
jgi:hypothetical protein